MPQLSLSLADSDTAIEPAQPAPVPSPPRRNGKGKLWRDGQRWTRWLHVYTSMITLLLVLFFGITGITLNHPEWTLGFDPSTSTSTGVLPDGWSGTDGNIEYLTISEFLRNDFGITGTVTDFGSDTTDGFISYRGPGYAADLFFDVDTGAFELSEESQGFVGVMNDLHKGRDSGSSWSWVIDVSAGFLVLISLTGLGLQLFLAKRRRSALIVAGVGVAATVVLTLIATS